MSVDPRGIKRGKCVSDYCDCENYDYVATSGTCCAYCQCPPTKHERLESTFDSDMSSSVLQQGADQCSLKFSSELLGDNIEASIDIIDETQIPENYEVVAAAEGVKDVIPLRETSQNYRFEDLLPRRLPKVLSDAIQQRKLTWNLRCRLVRSIADLCFGQSVPTYVIDSVANAAVQRWPTLGNEIGIHKFSTLAAQIKRRMSKLRCSSSRDSKCNLEVEKDIEVNNAANLTEMKTEMIKENPSVSKLKQLLAATREVRKADAKSLPSFALLQKYPALKRDDLMLWEFSEIIQLNETDCIQRFEVFLQKMAEYLDGKEGASCFLTKERLTVEILTKLPKIVPSGKRTKERRGFILEIFEENTPVEEVKPDTSDAPRLIAIGNKLKGELNFLCFVDGSPVFTTKNAIKAVRLLITVYWLFEIQFPVETRPSLIVLSAVFLGQQINKCYQKCAAAQNLLGQLKLNFNQ